MSYAPSPVNLSNGDTSKLIRGLDVEIELNGVAGGFIESLDLMPHNPIVAYKTGQPQQTVLLVRDEQGFGFSCGMAELGAKQMAWGVGQPVVAMPGTAYTTATPRALQFSSLITDFEGNQYVTLPDGNATGVVVTANPAGTPYTAGVGHDYILDPGAPGVPARLIRPATGSTIPSGGAILYTATMTPVAGSFVNVGGGTAIQPDYPTIIKFRNPQTYAINYYQHTRLNLAAGPNNYVWSLKKQAWQNATLTMEALPDPTFLDPNGNAAPFGFIYIPQVQ